MIQFSRHALSILGFKIHWYGLLIGLGAILGCLLAMKREKRLGLKKDTTVDLALIGMPLAILGARLYYVAFRWDYYISHPAENFALRDGGLAIYGGVIGMLLAGLIYSKWKKIPFFRLADLAAPGIALGQCIGRWGNFINQEAYGALVKNPALQFFPAAVMIDGQWHYACFFYESVWCGLIVLALLAGEKKRIFSRSGDVFLTYLFLYGLERGIVEGLRTDSLMIGPMRVSQLISIGLVILICLLRLKKPLPVILALCMAACAAANQTILTAICALLCLAFAAKIYHKQEIPNR